MVIRNESSAFTYSDPVCHTYTVTETGSLLLHVRMFTSAACKADTVLAYRSKRLWPIFLQKINKEDKNEKNTHQVRRT